jgi:hypothetical protein
MTQVTLSAQPSAVFNSPKFSSDAAAPSQRDSQLGNTNKAMIDRLVDSVVANGVHDSHADPFKMFGSMLKALIGIATCKQSPEQAYYAEQKLLELYADPAVSSSVNCEMIKQLIETQDSLSNWNPKSTMFAMPASLLHLIGQSARNGIDNQDGNSAIPPRRLDEIKSSLIDATGIEDERDTGRYIFDGTRFVTTDEVGASFGKVRYGYEQEINIGKGVVVEAITQQLDGLFNAASENGIAVAPLFFEGHFMLVTAKRSSVADKFELTIANTNVAFDATAISALRALSQAERNDPVKRREIQEASVNRYNLVLVGRLKNSFAGKSIILKIYTQHLQEHAKNSCGPLISMLAEHIAVKEPNQVSEAIVQCFNQWRDLNAQQQITAVMAQRSKLIGHAVEARRKSRFVDLSVLWDERFAADRDSPQSTYL